MRRTAICLVALLALMGLAGCKRSGHVAVADCGPQGVQSVHVDNYGGGGTGREVIVCRDGRVFVDG